MVVHVRRRLPALRRTAYVTGGQRDLTGAVERSGRWFAVLWSPNSAEHCPAYEEVARFRTLARAEAYLGKHLATASEAAACEKYYHPIR